VAAFTLGLVAALVVRWRWRSSAGLLVWLLAFAATTAGDVREVVTAPKWLAGLVRVSPVVVCALFPFAPGDARRAGESRLVNLFPALTLAALMIVASHLRSTLAIDRLVGYTGAALVAAAVVIHVGGTIPAYKQRNADDASTVRAVAASPERIVVADDMFTAQMLFPLYERKMILLADGVEQGAALGETLHGWQIPRVLLVTRRPGTVTLPPLKQVSSEMRGRMGIQVWSR
jgi:hypothetical protein